MKSRTKRIISTLAICGALILEAGAVAFGSLGKHSASRVDAADTVTMSYSGSSTTNMTGNNDAATVGLNAKQWSVVGDKGGNGNFPGLNKAGQIRLYGSATNHNVITVTNLDSQVISSIEVKYGASNYNCKVTAGGTEITGTGSDSEKTYNINSTSFNLTHNYSSNTQVYILSVVITYGSTPTSDYTVSFDLQGHGSAIDSQTISAGGKVTKPSDPSATGWTFGGWYKEQGCTTAYDFNTAVNSTFTLYAKWTPESPSPTDTISDGLIVDSSNYSNSTLFAYANCTSQGLGSGAKNNLSSNSTVIMTNNSGYFYNKVPTASPIDNIEIYSNAGASTSGSATVAFGTSSEPSGNTSTQTFSTSDKVYTFNAPAGDFNFIKITDGSSKKIQIQIKFNLKGQSADKLSTPSNIKYEDGVLSWTGDANATGYKVSVDDDAATTVTTTSYTVALSQCDSVSIIATDSTSTYKDSSAATYLYKNPGSLTNPLSVSDAVKLIEYETGKVNEQYTEEKIYVTGVTTADSSYNSKFSNYDKVTISDGDKTLTIQRATRSDGKSDTIKAGSTVVGYGYGEYYNGCTLYPNDSDNPVLTSVIGQTFTVSYKPGAYGTGSEQSDVKQEGVALTLKGAIFTRTGYTQSGWSTSDGGDKVYELNGSYTADAAATLYPFWTINTYIVTYAPGAYGAENQTTATKTHGVDLTLAGAIFTRTDYKQIGWATSDGGAKVYDLEGTYSANAATTLYPVWAEAEKHSVTYVANGATGDVPTQTPVAEGSSFTVASADGLTMEGYDFAGWSDGISVYAVGSTYTMETSDVTLTAQWELEGYTVTYALTGATVPEDAPTSVEEGDDLVVAVTPNQRCKIETMGVTIGGDTAEYTYENGVLTVENVTGNVVVTVNAVEKWYGATTQSSQNVTFGSIDAHLYHNEPLDVDVTANTGYHILDEYSSVAMQGESGYDDIPGAYSNGHIHVDHVIGNLILQIIAVKDTFSVTSTLNDSVVAEGSELPETVEYEDDLNVTFEPKTGYQINSITYKVGDAAEQTVTGSTLSIENITANVSITVNTSKIVYSVTATYGDSTNSNTTTSIEYGDSYSGKITPNDGKKFTSISMTMGGNPVTVAEDGSYSIASVTGNIVINVVTTDVTYVVSATGSNYTNNNSATSVLWHGAYEATITPDDGYFIEDLDVTMDGEPVTVSVAEHGESASISIASVTGDIDIDVTSTEIEVTGIASATTKEADYEFGYDFCVNDVTVIANFNDGTTGNVNATTIEGYDITKSGSQEVTVKVGEFEKEITVVVRASTVINLITASTTKTEIEYGGSFTKDDVKVTYHYTDGHTLPDQEAEEISEFDPTFVGEQEITVSAAGKTDTITVTVLPSTVIDHISASTEKSVVDYGSSFTKEDVKVTYHYTDGHTLPNQEAEEISEFDPTLVGEQEITVTAAGKTTTITVTVNDRVVTSLDVTGYTDTVDQGKDYVFDGEVKAHYADGQEEVIAEGYVVSKVDTSGHGDQKAKVSFGGVEVEITIHVVQTQTNLDATQWTAIIGGSVVGLVIVAECLFFFFKKFKI